MDDLSIVIEDPRWEALGLAGLAEAAIRATLTELALEPDNCEVTLLACDDARIAVLNGDFRAKPTPTNVLSWPAEERAADQPGGNPQAPEPGLDGLCELGDIAISFDTCTREAHAAGKPVSDHVTHLVVHGVLHLLGYDHETDADAALMEGLEVKILGKMGLNDPYRN
ncbi:rRNA maturation RNase YbeY [Sulfitobacter porphyrae]|uniref:Endoribonuclease YbeY n=1 Tax=Sulfitobacter porphyrae TaxID=1246864 RepID=A0ABW2B0P3_9RHOB|nr:endoribonuclease YbeY [Sulfitobacter porphyrae]